MPARVASLHVYPVKSCRGIPIDSFELGARGPRFDREWMVVSADTGKFATQREHPQLATVATSLEADALVLTFTSIGNRKVRVPLSRANGPAGENGAISANGANDQPERTVTVWGDECRGLDEGDEPAEFFSQLLGGEFRLVRMSPTFERRLPEKYGLGDAHTGFADGFPLLVVSLDSLADLNSRLSSPIGIDRFRANVVIIGEPAYQEDNWKSLRIGDVQFNVTKPCSRCVMINNDQETGAKSPEVLKTLASYRTIERKVYFGHNLTHLSPGRLKVGDWVWA